MKHGEGAGRMVWEDIFLINRQKRQGGVVGEEWLGQAKFPQLLPIA